MTVEYELFDVFRQQKVLGSVQTGPAEDLRMLAHRASDEVYEKLTGIRGAFATRILQGYGAEQLRRSRPP